MTRTFGAAVGLMRRLRVSHKFLLAGAPALLLLLVLGTGTLLQLNQRLKALQSKQVAAELMTDLIEWNKVLIESRRVSISSPDGNPTAALAAFNTQAQSVNRRLEAIKAKVDGAMPWFDMKEETAGLDKGWLELQRTVLGLPADKDFAQKAFAAHAPEYGRLYAYMRDLGNKSGLAQDPDADLSYLGFTLANNSPMTAGITVRIATYAALNIGRGDVTAKDKLFYEVTDARLNDTFGAVEALLSQSMRANPQVELALRQRFADLKDGSKGFLAFIRTSFTAADKVAVSSDALATAARGTVDAAWALVEGNRSVLSDLLRQRIERAALQRNVLAALMLLGVLSSAYLYVGIYLSIAASLRQASAAARAIAQGNLGTVGACASRDEFAELIADMRQADQALARVIAGVKQASDSIATASDQIAVGTQDLSSRTEQASSTLRGTAASMARLNETVAGGTQAAGNAAELASSAASVARSGGQTVSQVVTTMGDIDASSRQIRDIIGVIDGIAFQTNILALNAAVEAARAGDQGRGFAVVAGEVRLLAKRSAEASREIKVLIGTSVTNVEAGTRLVTGAGTTMTDIVAAVHRVHEVISEVTSAAAEQRDGILRVNGAVSELDQITRQNGVLVEQSAAAAGNLRQQAERLTGLVASFRIHDLATVDS